MLFISFCQQNHWLIVSALLVSSGESLICFVSGSRKVRMEKGKFSWKNCVQCRVQIQPFFFQTPILQFNPHLIDSCVVFLCFFVPVFCLFSRFQSYSHGCVLFLFFVLCLFNSSCLVSSFCFFFLHLPSCLCLLLCHIILFSLFYFQFTFQISSKL